MRICIDPGHGQDNRRAGVYDPGACHIEGNRKFEEADIALDYARDLADQLAALRHDVMLTRGDRKDPCPVWKRAAKAQLWKADALVSIHINDFDSDLAHGSEVLVSKAATRRARSEGLAKAVHAALVKATGLKSRGVKPAGGLSVLESDIPSILVEAGFIAHDGDRVILLDPVVRMRACAAMADAIATWGKGKR